jgi:uncharacterized alkaline shock family protein YloU
MQVINRIVAAIFAALLAAGSLVAIALITGGLSTDRLLIFERVRLTLEKLPAMGTAAMLTVFLLALLVLIFAGILFVYQFVSHGKSSGYLVREDESGVFTIAPGAIAAIAGHVGKTVGGVESVHCSSRQVLPGELEVKCRVIFRPNVPLDKTGQTYRDQVRAAIEEMTGLKVARLDLVASYKSGRPSTERRRYVA